MEFQVPVAGIKLHSKLVVHEDGAVTLRPMHPHKRVTPPLLNGKALVEKGVCYELNHGDVIDIGGAQFGVEWRKLPPGSAASALTTRPAAAGGLGSNPAFVAVKLERDQQHGASAVAAVGEVPGAAARDVVAPSADRVQAKAAIKAAEAAAEAVAVAAAAVPSCEDTPVSLAKRSAAAIEDELAQLLGGPVKRHRQDPAAKRHKQDPAQQQQQEREDQQKEQRQGHQQGEADGKSAKTTAGEVEAMDVDVTVGSRPDTAAATASGVGAGEPNGEQVVSPAGSDSNAAVTEPLAAIEGHMVLEASSRDRHAQHHTSSNGQQQQQQIEVRPAPAAEETAGAEQAVEIRPAAIAPAETAAAAAASAGEGIKAAAGAAAATSSSQHDPTGAATFRPAHRSRKQKHVTASVVDPLLPAAATPPVRMAPAKKPRRGRKPKTVTRDVSPPRSPVVHCTGDEEEAAEALLAAASGDVGSSPTAAAAPAAGREVTPVERRTARRPKPIFAPGSRLGMLYAVEAVISYHGGEDVLLPEWGATGVRAGRRVHPAAAAAAAHAALQAAGIPISNMGKKDLMRRRRQQHQRTFPALAGLVGQRVEPNLLQNVLSSNAAAAAVSNGHFAVPGGSLPAPESSINTAAGAIGSSLSALGIPQELLAGVLQRPELQQVLKVLLGQRLKQAGNAAAAASRTAATVRGRAVQPHSPMGLDDIGSSSPATVPAPAVSITTGVKQQLQQALTAVKSQQQLLLDKYKQQSQLGRQQQGLQQQQQPSHPQVLIQALRIAATAKAETGEGWEQVKHALSPQQQHLVERFNLQHMDADKLQSLAVAIAAQLVKHQYSVASTSTAPAPASSSRSVALERRPSVQLMFTSAVAQAHQQQQQQRVSVSGPPPPAASSGPAGSSGVDVAAIISGPRSTDSLHSGQGGAAAADAAAQITDSPPAPSAAAAARQETMLQLLKKLSGGMA